MNQQQNGNTSDQDIMANTGSYSPFSTIFGNVQQQAIPQQSFGAVQPAFGQVGYMSIEQVFAGLAMSAPQQSSTAINSTQNRNTTIQGVTSYQDQNGNVGMVMGYSASGAFK
jgi:hypothetical protein